MDLNPNKQGNYIAGTGQKFVSPEFLSEFNPDSVIVMNPIYAKEIQINELVYIVEEIAGIRLNRKYKLDAPKGVNGRKGDNTKIQKVFGMGTKYKALCQV